MVTICMHVMTLRWTFKLVKMVKFVLYVILQFKMNNKGFTSKRRHPLKKIYGTTCMMTQTRVHNYKKKSMVRSQKATWITKGKED